MHDLARAGTGRLLVIELTNSIRNFCADGRAMELVHVSRILSMQRAETSTADLAEHQGARSVGSVGRVHRVSRQLNMASAALVPLALKVFHKFGISWPNAAIPGACGGL